MIVFENNHPGAWLSQCIWISKLQFTLQFKFIFISLVGKKKIPNMTNKGSILLVWGLTVRGFILSPLPHHSYALYHTEHKRISSPAAVGSASKTFCKVTFWTLSLEFHLAGDCKLQVAVATWRPLALSGRGVLPMCCLSIDLMALLPVHTKL